jgi:6-pyruvoyltetrahydropterin/6-carboxytetrahydropterin synthase
VPYTICKQFTFHAAHQLYNHDGQCARPHGHTYKLEIMITASEPYPHDGGSQEGMVMDFDYVKNAYKTVIEPHVDHQDLNMSLGPHVGPTTCENMARHFFYLLLPHLSGLAGIRLWETPTSYAEYRP